MYRNNRSMDYGPEPFVVDIEKVTEQNPNYRTALWTGDHLQVTLMDIPVGGDVGMEIHPDTDQFFRIEEGVAQVLMGNNQNNLNLRARATDGDAIMIPAGTWHNIVNVGNEPLKMYSIYAPSHHPWGTVNMTKADAEAQEG